MERLIKTVAGSGLLTAESIGEFRVDYELSCYRKIIPSHTQEEVLGSTRINGHITHSEPEISEIVKLRLLESRSACAIIDDSGGEYKVAFVPRLPHFSVHTFPDELKDQLYPERR